MRVAIIGVGRGGPGVGAHSIGYQHALTYQTVPACTIVGAADLSADNLAAFARAFEVPTAATDYRTMLADARPDIVSVAVYAGARRQIIEDCAAAGVRGIWCEKPFALTMDDGRAMIAACERAGTKLIVNHQRRYLHAFREAKRLLKSGAIGAPVMFTGAIANWDLMEWGTHWLDMFRFFADDQPVTWVMGQARCTGAKRGYGHVMEEHAVAYFAFADGTRGLLDGGVGFSGDFALRLTGTEGIIDLFDDGRLLLLNADGKQEVPTRSTLHNAKPGFEQDDPWQAILGALLAWIDGGPPPDVAAANGLASSELYLAAYESAWRRDRIDLPLGSQATFPLDALAVAAPPA